MLRHVAFEAPMSFSSIEQQVSEVSTGLRSKLAQKLQGR